MKRAELILRPSIWAHNNVPFSEKTSESQFRKPEPKCSLPSEMSFWKWKNLLFPEPSTYLPHSFLLGVGSMSSVSDIWDKYKKQNKFPQYVRNPWPAFKSDHEVGRITDLCEVILYKKKCLLNIPSCIWQYVYVWVLCVYMYTHIHIYMTTE